MYKLFLILLGVLVLANCPAQEYPAKIHYNEIVLTRKHMMSIANAAVVNLSYCADTISWASIDNFKCKYINIWKPQFIKYSKEKKIRHSYPRLPKYIMKSSYLETLSLTIFSIDTLELGKLFENTTIKYICLDMVKIGHVDTSSNSLFFMPRTFVYMKNLNIPNSQSDKLLKYLNNRGVSFKVDS